MTIRQKRTLCSFGFLFFLLIILLFSAVSVHGTSAPTAVGTVTDSDGVNIRASYSTSSEIAGVIPQNGTVTVTKEKYTSETSYASTTRWYYVKSTYGNGWVRADLLTITYTDVSAKTTDSVNIRKGAGTSFDIVGTAAQGTTVSVRLTAISSAGETWYKVKYNGYNRYVHSDYVALSSGSTDDSSVSNNTDFESELAAFPETYHAYLEALHEEYPSWHFKAKNLSYTWSDALSTQYSNYAANTIASSFKDSYKAVAKGTYDFDNHAYLGLDGSGWVAASKKAVAYYMDPRNWLDEINVFMFESLSYDASTQKESMVKEILSETAIATKYSSSYMLAGETYNISPVYLAAKSRLELGSDDFMVSGEAFTYNGVTYSGLYNAYNIGASDSSDGSAAKKGLVFAGSGTSYLRPWNTLDKAIRGGAKYIAEDFVGNNQHTLYYERFNVANGLSCIGTHQYMTSTFAPATQANITYWNYEESDMLDTAFTFEIPVYQNMPSSRAGKPGSGNNNCYLDSLQVYVGTTRKTLTSSFDRFTSTYTAKYAVDSTVDEVTIKAVTNASDASVKITGNTNLQPGKNKITVKVTSSSGLVKYYYVYVTKNKSTTVEAPTISLSSDAETGKSVISWKAVENADKYKVYRCKTKDGSYTLLKTTTDLSYTDKTAAAGTKYYYKVKAVGEDDVVGTATSSIKYRTCDLPRPVIALSNKASTGKIIVSWKAVDGAEKYEVYRSDSKDGTYKKFYTTTGTRFVNTSAVAGTKYYYKVKAVHENSAADSAYSVAKYRTCDLSQPVVTIETRESDGKPKLTWESVSGALKYEIYRAEGEEGEYKKIYTMTGTKFTNTSAVSGTKYTYKVKAIHENSAANSAYSDSVYYVGKIDAPAITIGNRASDGKIQIKWVAVTGAEKYEVYRSTSKNGTYQKMLTTSKTSYTNTSAKAGNTYYYKVMAICAYEEGNSDYSTVKYRTCDLAQPVIKTGNRASDGKPQLTWEHIEGAVEYEVYRATSKTGTYKKMYTTTGTKYTNTSAVSGKTYYYKVRAIHTKASANSAYSTVKSVKCR